MEMERSMETRRKVAEIVKKYGPDDDDTELEVGQIREVVKELGENESMAMKIVIKLADGLADIARIKQKDFVDVWFKKDTLPEPNEGAMDLEVPANFDQPEVTVDDLLAPPNRSGGDERESVVMKRRRRKMRDKAQRKSLMMQSEQVEIIVRSYDKEGTGFLLEDTLEPLWDELGYSAVAKSVDAAKKEVLKDGKVSITEFMQWWFDEKVMTANVESKFQKLLKTITDDDIRRVFNQVDTDNDGFVRFREFCFAMEDLGLNWGIDEAKSTFKKLDQNRDKAIDFDEFKNALYIINADNMEVFWTRLLTGAPKEEKQEEEKVIDFTLESVMELIINKDGYWKMRVKALQALPNLTKDMKEEQFRTEFEKFQEPLTIQLKDRRSAVCREACSNLAEIIVQRREQFSPFVAFFFPHLMEVVRMKAVKVMSQSAHQCTKVLVSNVIDTPESAVMLTALTTCFETAQHGEVKKAVFEYLSSILEKMHSESEDVLKLRNDESYMDRIEKLLGQGISSSDAKTRSQAFTALAFVSFFDEERSKRIMESMSKAVVKKFNRVKNKMSETQRSASSASSPKSG